MKKQRKFLFAGATVTGLVGYLMWTGMGEAMTPVHTPTELVAKVAADPTYVANGLKVAGRVVPGTIQYDLETLDLRFDMVDIETGTTTFPVTYTGPLPETFKEGADVMAEGVYTSEGVFKATTVLTKCGSRYEAGEEEYYS